MINQFSVKTENQNTLKKICRFSDLASWKAGHQLVLFTYRITKKFPEEERFGLVNQMRRASVSVTSNIAEGFGRSSAKDKRHFYQMSRTSLAELENQFIIACELGFMKKEIVNEAESMLRNVEILLSGLIRSAKDYVRNT